ncbi:MAG TPA: hypothetical protein VK631_01885 [Solirubrobacteraceae bacterium]|nr:hypothetical protein [Solirubrobacteraceae bacterium]
MTSDVDKRGRLESDPFDARVTASGTVLISRGGRLVTTVRGRAAERLADALDRAAGDDRVTQLLLAKATGHYKH